jgi:hypothetical protein
LIRNSSKIWFLKVYCVLILPWFRNNLSSLNLWFTYKLNCLNIIIKNLKMFVKEQRVDGSWGLVKIGKSNYICKS